LTSSRRPYLTRVRYLGGKGGAHTRSQKPASPKLRLSFA
jgi:hypothetical protein